MKFHALPEQLNILEANRLNRIEVRGDVLHRAFEFGQVVG
jgi:hypothetical protein